MAPLQAGIAAARSDPKLKLAAAGFDVTGATSALRSPATGSAKASRSLYLTFDNDRAYSVDVLFNHLLPASGYNLARFVSLIEDNTAYGSNTSISVAGHRKQDDLPVIRFPREISLLRNAQVSTDQFASEGSLRSTPSPYLHLSLKDSSAQDSVPQFSREHTPLSQEAQLMAIARQLHRSHAQFISIAASNPLDQLFLAQFLHRACPDARLVFFGGDLLMVREVDNVPFIGSITVTPYPLIGFGQARAYSSSSSLAYYNAVSYTLWSIRARKTTVVRGGPGERAGLKAGDVIAFVDRSAIKKGRVKVGYVRNDKQATAELSVGDGVPLGIDVEQPVLQNYNPLQPKDVQQPVLWATALGSDGYYPLGVLSVCASDQEGILPTIDAGTSRKEACGSGVFRLAESETINYPSRLWVALCSAVCLLCFWHTLMLIGADYWSPFTRDLAVRNNDQPARRSLYIHVATAALSSMAFVVAFPVLSLSGMVKVNAPSRYAGLVALAIGSLAVVTTVVKTWEGAPPPGKHRLRRLCLAARGNVHLLFSILTGTGMLVICLLWRHICLINQSAYGTRSGESLYLIGLSFSYRSINPGSGVSPVGPVVLLLFSWYLWAFYQTSRLRFSKNGRPWLPAKLADDADNRLFVSDDELDNFKGRRASCLYQNITVPLITRELVRRFWRFRHGIAIDLILILIYAGLAVGFAVFLPIRSFDHFLWNGTRSSTYEFLVAGLFFPLTVMALTGWLRVILIWGSLREGLLERLESQPIRFAFSRLTVNGGWKAMLRSGGLHDQWRDMARSLESIRQMLHQQDLKGSLPDGAWGELDAANRGLLEKVSQLRRLRASDSAGPGKPDEHDYDFMTRIEKDLAAFSQRLLSAVLIPYWKDKRVGLVESEAYDELPVKARRSLGELEHPYIPMELRVGPASAEPAQILVAEEFVAIRYLSLIRAVLVNMRYLMIFISTSFVLALMAWNAYPFQPRQEVDWLFTSFLAFLGAGIILVYAQMHRNPILSRITDTKPNELGWDFYFRIISLGVFPVFAWIAYQFPDVGSVIYKFLQPGVPVIK